MQSNVLLLLPARVRQGIYIGYGLVVIVTGATQVGYAAVEDLSQPVWLTVTLAVVTFLGVPVTALAATNVSSDSPPRVIESEIGSDPADEPEVITADGSRF